MASKQVKTEPVNPQVEGLLDDLFKEYAPIIGLTEGGYFVGKFVRSFWMPSNSEFAVDGRIPAMEFVAVQGSCEVKGEPIDLVMDTTYAFPVVGVGLLNQLKNVRPQAGELIAIRFVEKVTRADKTTLKKYRVSVNRQAVESEDPLAPVASASTDESV